MLINVTTVLLFFCWDWKVKSRETLLKIIPVYFIRHAAFSGLLLFKTHLLINFACSCMILFSMPMWSLQPSTERASTLSFFSSRWAIIRRKHLPDDGMLLLCRCELASHGPTSEWWLLCAHGVSGEKGRCQKCQTLDYTQCSTLSTYGCSLRTTH